MAMVEKSAPVKPHPVVMVVDGDQLELDRTSKLIKEQYPKGAVYKFRTAKEAFTFLGLKCYKYFPEYTVDTLIRKNFVSQDDTLTQDHKMDWENVLLKKHFLAKEKIGVMRKMAKEMAVTVIFWDSQMPNLSALELLDMAFLEKETGWQVIPIVVMCTNFNTDMSQWFASHGAAKTVEKPFTRASLDRVRQLLE